MHHSRHDDAGAHRLGYSFSQRWIPITPITLFWKEMLFIREMNCAEVRQFYFQNGKVGCAFPKSFNGRTAGEKHIKFDLHSDFQEGIVADAVGNAMPR